MALTFATLLSLLPLLALLFSVFKLLGGGEWFFEVVRPAYSALFAPGVQPMVTEKITKLVANFSAKTVGVVSFVVLVAGVHSIFVAVEATFNLIWGGAPRGKFLVRAPIYWGLFLAIPILLAAAIAFTTYVVASPLTTEVAVHFSFLQSLLQSLIPALMIILSFILLYKYLPTAPVHWSAALVGGVTAGIFYELSKHLFIFYAAKLVKYDVMYGSVAIIPMAMIWVNISWLIALLGIEIAYIYQHFAPLRREQKHIHLTRLQRDALAIRLLLSAIKPDHSSKAQWVNFGALSEEWELPPGAALEAVDKLERAGLIHRTNKEGEFYKVVQDVEDMKLSEVENTLNTQNYEVWRWPNEVHWEDIKQRLDSKEPENRKEITLLKMSKAE